MKETWSERICLVTGVNGFVASHIAKKLAVLGAEVFGVTFKKSPFLNIDGFYNKKATVLYGDITDYEFMKDIFRLNHIDTCFHLAASTIISKAAQSPLATFQTNIMGTCNVLETARNCETIERIVVASSDKAYGFYKESQLPYQEEYELRGTGVYECSKACADMIARSYFFNYSLPVVVTRC